VDKSVKAGGVIKNINTLDNAGVKEETKTSTRKTLYIVQTCKSADDMASAYGFTAEQVKMLHELLRPEYDSMWQAVLYGVHNGDGDIVEVAISQLGNVGGQPYWSWYGFSSRVEWCACFVSWCANQCGYIDAGIIPKYSLCTSGVQWFKDAGQWEDGGATPAPGDIIFFDWDGDGKADHTGIVESSDGSTVHTVEGNSGDQCRRGSYNVSYGKILGYGCPDY
jgi:hypothetical protein